MIKKKYGKNIQLLLSDTYPLMYEVCNDDFYQVMWAMKGQFDFARYRKNSPFIDPTNNKMVGKFNNEASGQSITEFVGLKPKMFSYQTLNDSQHGEAGFTTKKRAKGIQRAACENCEKNK